ncbi:hypothetical protein ACNKHW_25910 [Shigella flexneri]
MKGATPAASDIQEAKEILVKHYDNMSRKSMILTTRLPSLQAKRKAGAATSRIDE